MNDCIRIAYPERRVNVDRTANIISNNLFNILVINKYKKNLETSYYNEKCKENILQYII